MKAFIYWIFKQRIKILVNLIKFKNIIRGSQNFKKNYFNLYT